MATPPGVALVNMGSHARPGRRGRGRAAERRVRRRRRGARADDGTEPPSDLNASPEYRRHLARVLVGRALDTVAAGSRPMTATTFGAGSLVGVPVRRVEDPTLLRGEGTYIDNLALPGALHLAFVRSPMAHAEIRSIDTSDARAMPGVVAVYSADDLDFPDHTGMMQLHPAVGAARARAREGALRRRHRRVVVVAETKAQAVDAAEAVIVDYDPLPAVVRHGARAGAGRATTVRRDRSPTS